jgi:hypothetical protein
MLATVTVATLFLSSNDIEMTIKMAIEMAIERA